MDLMPFSAQPASGGRLNVATAFDGTASIHCSGVPYLG